ncbi:MAG: TolC family protein [Armatimonadota bacterium]|jgi:outer membrane protein TolC
MIRRLSLIFISLGVVIALTAGLATASADQQKLDSSGQPVISKAISLDDAVNIALENNPSIASRKALVNAAAAKVGIAKAMTKPQVSASTFGTLSNTAMILSGPGTVQPQNILLSADKRRLDQSLMGMYPIYTGGNLKGQVDSTQAQQQASSFDAATTELDTALIVKNAYYETRLAQKYIDAYQSRVDEATERVRIAEEAFAAGRIAKFDLLRNQTDLAEAQQQLNDAQRYVETSYIELKNIMGISQTSQLTLTQDLSVRTAPPDLDELQATALSARPEVQAARARVRSAKANVDVAKSSYKPQVYATAMANLSANIGDSMNGHTDTGYLVGVTAALPVFDGGLRKSSVDEAESIVDQMQADERAAVLDVSRSVATAYAQFGAATKNIDLAQTAVTAAEEDYRVIRMRYEAGKATNVEVLDALAALTRAQTMYAEALYGQNIARESLNRAIGQR